MNTREKRDKENNFNEWNLKRRKNVKGNIHSDDDDEIQR